MKIKCTQCNHPFESLIIDPEIAWKEVYTLLLKHVAKHHPKENQIAASEMQKVGLALVGFCTIATFCEIEEPAPKWLEDHITDMQDCIMQAIGFDPTDEDNEDSEENNEESVLVEEESTDTPIESNPTALID